MGLTPLERIKLRTQRFVDELMRRKAIDLGEAALIAEYSYWYFRSYVLKALMMLYPGCIKVERHTVYWVCDER